MDDRTRHSRHSRRFLAFADAIGPGQAAALAGTAGFLETDELARIALTGTPTDPRSIR